MTDLYREISERRQNLIRIARSGPTKEFGAAVEQSDTDDLEWLLERLDSQLGETPYWVKDEERLSKIMADFRRMREAVAGVLGNKRTVEKIEQNAARRIWDQTSLWVKVALAVGGWIVAAALAIQKGQ